LQTVPAREEDLDNSQLAKTAGFSLHAGVAAKTHQRRKLERLCRYEVQESSSVAGGREPGATIARPAVATDRLTLTPQGNVRYDVKGFTNAAGAGCARAAIARLAALVPKPRVNLTHFARIVLILARFAGPLKPSKLHP